MSLRVALPCVGTQRRRNGGHELAQDAIFLQALDAAQFGIDGLQQLLLAGVPISRVSGVEPSHKQTGDQLCDGRVVVQGCFDVALAEGEPQLLEVAGVSAQHHDGARVQRGVEYQLVEVVAFHLAPPRLGEQFFKA